MKQLYFFLSLLLSAAYLPAVAQSNILVTNPLAEDILFGNFDPADYLPANPVSEPQAIATGIEQLVSLNSLKA